jgi:hypothetical protein
VGDDGKTFEDEAHGTYEVTDTGDIEIVITGYKGSPREIGGKGTRVIDWLSETSFMKILHYQGKESTEGPYKKTE